jgi:hypothetical protein
MLEGATEAFIFDTSSIANTAALKTGIALISITHKN